jgi:hypothetical protein
MITSHEFLVAHWTRKVLFSCVGTSVPGQFVRTGESLAAVAPTAGKWSLSCNKQDEKIASSPAVIATFLPRTKLAHQQFVVRNYK